MNFSLKHKDKTELSSGKPPWLANSSAIATRSNNVIKPKRQESKIKNQKSKIKRSGKINILG